MRPQASPTKSIDDTGQEPAAPPLTENDVALLHEIVKLAESRDADELAAHPRKVLFDAYHAVFREYGVDTAKDKACLRVLLSLAGPHVMGKTLMEKFKGVIREAGFELEYTDEDLHVDQADVGDQTMAESEAIVKELQRQRQGRGPQAMVKHQQPVSLEGEDSTQERPKKQRSSKSVPDLGRGSQQSVGSQGKLGGFTYQEGKSGVDVEQAMNIDERTEISSVADGQTEPVTFPEPDPAAIQEFARRIAAMEELAVAKDSHQLKADSFRIWRDSTREKKAKEFRERKLLSRATSQFASRQHNDYTANAMYKEILGKRSKETMESWRAEARLRPLERRVAYRHDLGLADKCIREFRLLLRLPAHAEVVRKVALKRKGFDEWSDALRHKAMQEIIERRILNWTIYTWTFAMRDSIFKRHLEQRRQHKALHLMLTHYRQQQDRLQKAEDAVVASKSARRILGAFVAMSLKLEQQRRYENMADQFYHPKIEFENLRLLKNKMDHVQKLTLKANDAREYFLSVKFLDIWKTRTKQAKEQRLNQAYKQMRRRGKIRIVQTGLSTWRGECNRLQMLGGVERDLAHQRDHRLLRKHLNGWRNRASQVNELDRQASSHFEVRLLAQTFQPVIARSRELKSLSTRADEFFSIHTSDNASRQLRKLKTKAFQLRRRQQDADAVKDRFERNHYRSMLRLWARKTAGKDQHPEVSILENPEEEANRIMDESVLPDIEDEESTAPGPNTHKKRTPIPEYLHTPSNRAARVRALATSTTPATAPPPSFAARLLAGGISMTPRGPPPN